MNRRHGMAFQAEDGINILPVFVYSQELQRTVLNLTGSYFVDFGKWTIVSAYWLIQPSFMCLFILSFLCLSSQLFNSLFTDSLINYSSVLFVTHLNFCAFYSY